MLEITIDTREQTPFHFDECVAKTRIGTLKTGDYACTGDRGFAVERKSLDDFLGTISSGWDRFQREIFRAKTAGFSLPIVVEGNLDDICFHLDEVVCWIAVSWLLKSNPVGHSKYTDSEMIAIIRGIYRGDETSRNVICPQHSHFNLTPAFVLKRCGEIEHLGGHVQFCGSSAVAMCHTHLNERWSILKGDEQ